MIRLYSQNPNRIVFTSGTVQAAQEASYPAVIWKWFNSSGKDGNVSVPHGKGACFVMVFP